MYAQGQHAEALGVNSLTFSPHTPSLLCSTGCDDTAALWDARVPSTAGSSSSSSSSLTGVQSLSCVLRLRPHRAPVNHALFAPQHDTMLLTASDDATVACWDLRRPDMAVERIGGYGDGVNKLLLVPAAAVLRSQRGGQSPLLPPPPASSMSTAMAAVQPHDTLLLSACDDGMVYVHALGAQHHQQQQQHDHNNSSSVLLDRFWVSTSTVNDLLLLPDSDVIVTSSEDGALRSWRLLCDASATTEQRLVASLDAFESAVNHVVLVPASHTALLRDDDDDANDAEDAGSGAYAADAAATTTVSAATPSSRVGHDDDDDDDDRDVYATAATAIAAAHAPQRLSPSSPHTRWLLAASAECIFGVDVDTRTGRYGAGARRFVGHRDYVRGIEFTPRHPHTLLSVADDGTLIEWQLRSGEVVRQVALHDGYVMASAIAPGGDVLATGSHLGEVRLWRLPLQTECIGAQPQQ